MPQRGPLASQRTSLAIFMRLHASVLSAPCSATSASCEASASNLFGAVTNGWPVSVAISRGDRVAYSGCALSPVPTAVPPSASSWSARRARARIAAHAVIELRDPAADLLAERQRRRVLQVRAADLDDVRERLRLAVERARAARATAGSRCSSTLLDGRDVHRGRERVVRRLRHVDVIVRVHRRSCRRACRRRARSRGSRSPR